MTVYKLRRFGLCAVAGFAAFGSCAASAALHATDEFVTGATRPVSIVLLPAHVQLLKQRMMHASEEVEESGALEGHLSAAVAAELKKRGYEVRALTAEGINADPQLQEHVVDADRRFGELLTQVQVKLPRQIGERRYQAGDEMKLLANSLGADAIAFVRMQVMTAAKGVQVMNMGMGGTQTMMSVTIIDGQTSMIEAYLTLPLLRRGKAFGGYEDMMKDPDVEMARYAELTLEEFPTADPAARTERSGEDVIGDVESLLGK